MNTCFLGGTFVCISQNICKIFFQLSKSLFILDYKYVRRVISFRILRHLTRRAAFPYPDFGAREKKSPSSSMLGTCMSSSTGVQMLVSEVVASISCLSDGPEITWSSRQNSGFDVYFDPRCSHPHRSGKAFIQALKSLQGGRYLLQSGH